MLQLKKLSHTIKGELKETFVPRTVVSIVLGTAITTFGLYNVHQQADITEGGILGLILLLNFWLGVSSSMLSPVLDCLSYLMGFKYLGKEFLKTSIFATACMAGFFRLWELFPPVLPSLADSPFFAAVAGGCFIGIGCGLVCRRFDCFKEITLDFKDITEIGQGFAHELFVVFKRTHPDIKINIVNESENVRKMINHVTLG